MAKPFLVALASAPMALVGCHSSDDLPSGPPTKVTQVATGGFISPTDAVASPDGKTFYFAAYTDDEERLATVFQTAAQQNSTAAALATGEPLEMPIGLVMSCDGKTVYVADKGAGEDGSVLAVTTGGGEVSDLGAIGLSGPAGLAMGKDCKTLYVTGRTTEGEPAAFALSTAGGQASLIYKGEPLASPTGLHIDDDNNLWVMDHLAHGETGEGVLFKIPADGSSATEVASNLRMGTPGGVSLAPGGVTAIMPTRDADGRAQLTAISTATGELVELPTPELSDPAGIRSARNAPNGAVVDSEGAAIYVMTFED